MLSKDLVLLCPELRSLLVRIYQKLVFHLLRKSFLVQRAKKATKNSLMSSFFWNVRGLNKSTKHSIIRGWINSMKFGCLIETRVKENKSQSMISSYFNDLVGYVQL